jgi:hypothetical protein
MKTTVQLDYPAILANSAQPVHLAFPFTAPGPSGHRAHPIAFSVGVIELPNQLRGRSRPAVVRQPKTGEDRLRAVVDEAFEHPPPFAQGIHRTEIAAQKMQEFNPVEFHRHVGGPIRLE